MTHPNSEHDFNNYMDLIERLETLVYETEAPRAQKVLDEHVAHRILKGDTRAFLDFKRTQKKW